MSELDLTPAVEAGVAFFEHLSIPGDEHLRRMVELTIRATLPLILTTLADQAEAEVECDHGCASEMIPDYIRAKAEEASK